MCGPPGMAIRSCCSPGGSQCAWWGRRQGTRQGISAGREGSFACRSPRSPSRAAEQHRINHEWHDILTSLDWIKLCFHRRNFPCGVGTAGGTFHRRDQSLNYCQFQEHYFNLPTQGLTALNTSNWSSTRSILFERQVHCAWQHRLIEDTTDGPRTKSGPYWALVAFSYFSRIICGGNADNNKLKEPWKVVPMSSGCVGWKRDSQSFWGRQRN